MPPKLNITPEIKSTLEQGGPVVALESTLITHGFPAPDNLRIAQEIEMAVREQGAVPAEEADPARAGEVGGDVVEAADRVEVLPGHQRLMGVEVADRLGVLVLLAAGALDAPDEDAGVDLVAEDPEDALRMLRLLSGREHQVLSSVALIGPHFDEVMLQSTSVRMARIAAAEMQAYVESGEPFGKAGAYAIQGRAACFIASIAGSYSGVMSLPLFETATLLRRVGLV